MGTRFSASLTLCVVPYNLAVVRYYSKPGRVARFAENLGTQIRCQAPKQEQNQSHEQEVPRSARLEVERVCQLVADEEPSQLAVHPIGATGG